MNNQNTTQDDNQLQMQAATATISADAQGDFEIIGGVACPIDPMERLQCDSCQ